jgi:hypothetical protein
MESKLDLHPVKQTAKGKTVNFSDNKNKTKNPNMGTPGSAARMSSAKKDKPEISKFSADQTDRIFTLEKENTVLKSKENLLE